tara:strand:- start:4611 stop:5165 length:555 start_codon:yes stop_codon:yes gene_type:complete
MAVDLASHIHEMNNRELNTIAQLRFTDNETQIKLAKHPYLLCRKYLASNPRLCVEAKNILLDGRANSVKYNLMTAGHLNDTPKKISELYWHEKRRGIMWWRVGAFVRGWWRRKDVPNTPPAVLQDIYDNFGGGLYGSDQTLVSVLKHPNSTLKMAVVASTSEVDIVKQAGFARLIELENTKEAK